MDLKSFLKNELQPLLEKDGNRLVKTAAIPAIIKKEKQLDAHYWRAVQTQNEVNALLTEWDTNEGKKSAVILKYTKVRAPNGAIVWGTTLLSLEANPDVFENAKQNYINAVLNITLNPQYVATINATRKKQLKDQKDYNDAMHKTLKESGRRQLENYAKNPRIREGTNRQTHNAITGVETIYDLTSGKKFEVESGSNYYYMNQNGEYIGTDDPNWNMNGSQNINGNEWTLLETIDN